MKLLSLAVVAGLVPFFGPSAPQDEALPGFRAVEIPNHLTLLEARAGWRLLFDGETTAGWVDGRNKAPTGWVVDDECLHRAEAAGDLFTAERFGDFELTFEWKVTPGVNSGVKYRLDGVGPEYQVLGGDPENPKHSATALYDVVSPTDVRLRPAGWFNQGRIVARGNTIEHWLNGVRVVQADVSSDEWKDAVAKSKFKDVVGFGLPKESPIMLQDHGGAVWYRSLKIREFDELPGEEVVLFDGEKIEGWRALGDAIYEAADGSILGRIGGGSQSFLVTERTFGDFILEVEVKAELPGNSGIQIRSHQRENGRLYGYQIEIDSSDRAWSGGLYDEARRGWLQNLKHNEPGRQAFKRNDWNLYRIECVGPWIRVWLNGVPTVDYFDTADLEGVIGLQVHSGNNTRVRWRNFRMRDLGSCRWEATEATTTPDFLEITGDRDFAIRATLPPQESELTLGFDGNIEGWRGQIEWFLPFRLKDDPPAGSNILTICCFGDLLTAHLNGRPVHSTNGYGTRVVRFPNPPTPEGTATFERLVWD